MLPQCDTSISRSTLGNERKRKGPPVEGDEMRDAGEVDGHNLRRGIRGKRGERSVDQCIVSLREWVQLSGGLQLPGGKLEADLLLRGRIGRLDEESLGECVLRSVLLTLINILNIYLRNKGRKRHQNMGEIVLHEQERFVFNSGFAAQHIQNDILSTIHLITKALPVLNLGLLHRNR